MNLARILSDIELNDDLNLAQDTEAKIRDAIAAVRTEGKTAKVTLVLTATWDNKRGGVRLAGKATSKLPEAVADSQFFYVTEDNEPTREKPGQPSLPFARPQLLRGGAAPATSEE